MNKRRSKSEGQSNKSYQLLEPRNLLATFVVDTSVDSMTPELDGKISLREAIVAANTNASYGDAPAGDSTEADSVVIDLPDNDRWISLMGPELEITESVLIRTKADSPHAVILQHSGNRILRVEDAGQVDLQDLTLTQGVGSSGGGAIHSVDSDLSLTRVKVRSSRATSGDGGGVLVQGGTLTTHYAQFAHNSAGGVGGALAVEGATWNDFGTQFLFNRSDLGGGGASISSSTADLERTRFYSGVAYGAVDSGGGGMHITGDSDVTLTLAAVSSNRSHANGGGIYSSSTGTLLLRGTRLFGNNAEMNGGAIHMDGGTLVAEKFGSVQTGLGGFSAYANLNGGGFSFHRTQATLTDLRTWRMTAGSETSATDGFGGAIYSVNSNVQILGKDTMIFGKAYHAGGAIAVIGGTMRIDSGGTIPPNLGNYYSYRTIRDSIATIDGRIELTEDSAFDGLKVGAGIYASRANLVLNGVGIEAEIDYRENGRGGAIYLSGSNAVVGQTLIRNSRASLAGGGIFSNRGTELRISDSLLHDNALTRTGGLIYTAPDTETWIHRTTVRRGRAFIGGGIANHGYMAFHQSKLESNVASSYNPATRQYRFGIGGGVYTTGRLHAGGSRFEGNWAGRGGAVATHDSEYVILNTSQFHSNHARWSGRDHDRSQGGAIAGTSDHLHLSYSQFTHNSSANGGAVSFTGGRLSGSNLTFGGPTEEDGNWVSTRANLTRSSGGALKLAGNVEGSLSNVKFLNNRATLGGAVSLVANSAGMPHLVIADRSIFNFNSATRDDQPTTALESLGGGAIANLGARLEVRDSFFSENFTDRYGGALVNFGDNAETLLHSVRFTENEAETLAGAIFNDAHVGLFDSSLFNNQGGTGAGGIFNTINSTLEIENTVFEGNS